MLYNLLIHSHFMYGSLIWLNYLTNKQINSLKTIQKKALRIIHNKPYNSHTSKLFHTSKITKIEHLHEKESLILMFKYMNNKLPQDTQKLISTNIQTPNIETRSMTANQLKPKRGITKGVLDIIDAWNNNNTVTHGVNNIRKLKNNFNEQNNKVQECNKDNCYACNKTE